jgi:DNA invertase Pin-like site-specific DNA recombinase
MKLGYARVSTSEQDTQAQQAALVAAGCECVFVEVGSGGRFDRPELQRLLDHVRAGDTIVVWKLDRLSRSLKDLLALLERIERAGASFQSLTESVDTSAPAGRMLMQMLGTFAEFERSMLRERTLAGLKSAHAAGRRGGRPRALNDTQEREIVAMLTAGRTAADAARLVGVSRSTVSRLQDRICRKEVEETSLRR